MWPTCGKRIAVNRGGTRSYLASDHPSAALRTGLGSTSVWTDSNGNEGGNQRYYAYGANRAGSGDIPTDYQFTGQRRDFNSNLYQMGVRWYDPLVGRFLSPDTIVPKPENPQTLNRYSYTANNPLKYVDPTGHDLVIVQGFAWSSPNDFNNPSSWKQWIMEYKGWSESQWTSWKESWMSADFEGRLALGREQGVYIVPIVADWEPPALGKQADMVQSLIDYMGLKDVTIVAHSRAATMMTSLLKDYQEGTQQPGEVKNVVLIDGPQGTFGTVIGGNVNGIDAQKTGVKVVSILGPAACFGVSPCASFIENDTEFRIVDNHDIQDYLAKYVYRYLDIYEDWNARPDPRWDDEEGWY